ncbi:MAG: Rieske 2Fe-2S domain-containing protein [Bifidobacteriaceae bacterium]|jgi:3-phenylpropionate/trans-cinnamate dioxygenase ferredoxin subunit|nr:Rieske 2Fe-2S domain-containing protein [Bifidobacteriaceae bacterium]
MTSLPIAPAEQIAPGAVKAVQVRLGPLPAVIGPAQEMGPAGTTAIVVAHTADDQWYAIGDVCSHGPVLLSEGEFEGCTLECWGHGSRFDLSTGLPQNLPANQGVPTYPVSVENGQVVIDLPAVDPPDTPDATKAGDAPETFSNMDDAAPHPDQGGATPSPSGGDKQQEEPV